MAFWERLFGEDSPRYPEFPSEWRTILEAKVAFYRALDEAETIRFESAMLRFLNTTKIVGIQTDVSDMDRVLISASAVIPIFAFPNWEYHNLDEVLLYPAHFNGEYEINSKDATAILGQVGYGYMEGIMILSKKALYHGFENDTDKQNTAIHEFVHLIDKLDGQVDGLMVHLTEHEYALPWLYLIDRKIEEILEGKSDIRVYGATNRAEFIAVAAEYFFERPKLLRKKHPKLYEMMEQLFGQRMADRDGSKAPKVVRHFDPCPCGSGKKFKDCCMKNS